jgi:TetR/AcrR family transcriptional repressor of lmrAB and yxaGH operons
LHGYSAVGLAQILKDARAPKGSLYYHFPKGKADLAKAAAHWASAGVLQLIALSYQDAPDLETGTTNLCCKLAKAFDAGGCAGGCPVTSTLQDPSGDHELADYALELLDGWSFAVREHAERFGLTSDESAEYAQTLMIGLQGAWVMARLTRHADVIRGVPKLVAAAGRVR